MEDINDDRKVELRDITSLRGSKQRANPGCGLEDSFESAQKAINDDACVAKTSKFARKRVETRVSIQVLGYRYTSCYIILRSRPKHACIDRRWPKQIIILVRSRKATHKKHRPTHVTNKKHHHLRSVSRASFNQISPTHTYRFFHPDKPKLAY